MVKTKPVTNSTSKENLKLMLTVCLTIKFNPVERGFNDITGTITQLSSNKIRENPLPASRFRLMDKLTTFIFFNFSFAAVT